MTVYQDAQKLIDEAVAAGHQTTVVLREPCGECGAMCEPGEYHRYSFCVLVKAGLDPWQEIRIIAGQLGLDDPGDVPPKVWEIHE